MLPAIHRLTRDRDFKRIAALGRAVYAADLRLKYIPNHRPQSRFAFVVSTKVSKLATRRNRLKRQLREIIRTHRQDVKPGFDIMISPRSSALTLPFGALTEQVLGLLMKARLRL